MENVMYELIALGVVLGCMFGLWLGKVVDKGKARPMSVKLTSVKTGASYHGDKWRVDKDGIPSFRIWNTAVAKYEWYPIWHFENPFLTMYVIDREWAISHMWLLMGVPKRKSEEKH